MLQSSAHQASESHSNLIVDESLNLIHVSGFSENLFELQEGHLLSSHTSQAAQKIQSLIVSYFVVNEGNSVSGYFSTREGKFTRHYDIYIEPLILNGMSLALVRLVNCEWIESAVRMGRSLDKANVGMLDIDATLNCSYSNEGWAAISGQTSSEAIGLGWTQFFSDSKRKEVLNWLRFPYQNVVTKEFTAALYIAEDEIRYSRWILQLDPETATTPRAITAVVTDVTEEVLKAKEAENLARYDNLTGLVNRAFFQSQLQIFVDSNIRDQDLSLLYLDLDGFKAINDTYGHQAGDAIIIEVANRMKRVLRKGDIAARLGGDEFAIILNGVQDFKVNSERVAEKLLVEINKPYILKLRDGPQEVFVGVSIGIAGLVNELEHSHSEQTSEVIVTNMMAHADFAMYRAKHKGKNRYRFYDKALDVQAREGYVLKTEICSAVARKELILHYQPIVSSQSGRVEGSEALLRWDNETFSDVSIDEVVDTLEKSALCLEFGKDVVRQSLSHLQEIQSEQWLPAEYYLSINLSPLQIHDSDFVDWLLERITESDVNASSLQIEITERIFAEGAGPVIKNLHRLQGVGVRIALDDFGVGGTALDLLEVCPITCVKMDRSLILRSSYTRGEAVTRAVLRMCRELGIATVAEGVETLSQLELMRSMDCDCVQGFLLSPVMSAESHLEYLLNTEMGYQPDCETVTEMRAITAVL